MSQNITIMNIICPSFTLIYYLIAMSHGSVASIATAYGLEDRGPSSSPNRLKNFHFSVSSRLALGFPQPPIHWVPGVKQRGCEADHSSPTSCEVRKM
jgi:hypothetical protein